MEQRTNYTEKIKLAIVGFGNLGKGIALAATQNPDLEIVGIFTRRAPESIQAAYPVYAYEQIFEMKSSIDVAILCGGSLKDLPEQILELSPHFNTVDSFDTHAKIPEYFEQVNKINTQHKTLSLIATGWDPGLFSMARLIGQSILPVGQDYTFWGEGLSQGHSDAIRRVQGVKYAAQYTLPLEEALEEVRAGAGKKYTAQEMHRRICYVVVEEGADKSLIEKEIKTMPHYFEPYQTEVHFINEALFMEEHQAMPHGGFVIRTGTSAANDLQKMEFSLQLASNPNFTSSVLLSFARAVAKMSKEGHYGTKTVFDIPLGYLSAQSPEELRKTIL